MRTAVYRVGVDGGLFLGPFLSGLVAGWSPGLMPGLLAIILLTIGVMTALAIRRSGREPGRSTPQYGMPVVSISSTMTRLPSLTTAT